MIAACNFRGVYRVGLPRVRPISSPIAFVTGSAGYRRTRIATTGDYIVGTGGAPLYNDLERFVHLFINQRVKNLVYKSIKTPINRT